MKKYLIAFIFLLLTVSFVIAQSMSFKKGVGYSQAFESGSSVYDIRFNYYDHQDFLDLKKLGIDQVRLPIFMKNMVNTGNDNQLEPLFFYLLDQYVDMAEAEDLNLILTNMSAFDYNNDTTVKKQLINIWTQIAKHYKNRLNKVFYELSNEPGYDNIEEWGVVQGELIDSIRTIDTIHTLIVTPAWGGSVNLKYLPEYDDDNLIYTFHFYDPFIFTHQGAQHVGLEELQGVPFPYDAEQMPELPASLIGTQYENDYNNYVNLGTIETIRGLIDTAVAFKEVRNVPVWCGEFGADDKYSTTEDRALWYETLRTVLEENGIAWSMLGYTRYWGLFEYGTNKLFDYDLNIPIVEAMGLNSPLQSEFEIQPDTASIVFYDDYVNHDIDLWISVDDTLSHVYSQNNPKNNKFCIQMKDFPIWNYFRFDFIPDRDFSRLVEEEYYLSFWVKGDTPGVKFNMRFFDTDTDDPDDHPWRMVHDIDESLAPWDNEWHLVQIPLMNFIEQGAYDDDTWHDPEGKFDWSAIDEFHIQTEFEGLEGKQFWFDDIEIIKGTNTGLVEVTFHVDMQNEDVSELGIFLRGSFNNWISNNPMSNDGSIYYKTLELEPGTEIEYKFVNGDNWESNIPNTCTTGDNNDRVFVVPEKDSILSNVCFNSCEICTPTAIEEHQNTDIYVFPNPTENTVKITNLPVNKDVNIKVYNANGQLLSDILSKNKSSLLVNLSSMNSGIYVIKIKSENVNETLKIVKTSK